MREKLIRSDAVECVIGLGPNLFYNSPMEACIMICRMNKRPDRRGQVLAACREIHQGDVVGHVLLPCGSEGSPGGFPRELAVHLCGEGKGCGFFPGSAALEAAVCGGGRRTVPCFSRLGCCGSRRSRGLGWPGSMFRILMQKADPQRRQQDHDDSATDHQRQLLLLLFWILRFRRRGRIRRFFRRTAHFDGGCRGRLRHSLRRLGKAGTGAAAQLFELLLCLGGKLRRPGRPLGIPDGVFFGLLLRPYRFDEGIQPFKKLLGINLDIGDPIEVLDAFQALRHNVRPVEIFGHHRNDGQTLFQRQFDFLADVVVGVDTAVQGVFGQDQQEDVAFSHFLGDMLTEIARIELFYIQKTLVFLFQPNPVVDHAGHRAARIPPITDEDSPVHELIPRCDAR